MIHHLRGCRFSGLSVGALLALAFLPTTVLAQPAVHFRNDTGVPITVQAAFSVPGGGVQRDRAYNLQNTEGCRIVLPGTKLITIYNPKMPNQVLSQTSIPANPEDLYFSVQFDSAQNKVGIVKVKPPPR